MYDKARWKGVLTCLVVTTSWVISLTCEGYCETVPSIYDSESVLMDSHEYDCLIKTDIMKTLAGLSTWRGNLTRDLPLEKELQRMNGC